MVCPYRHNLLTDQPECSLWQSGKCQNVKCIYRHPKKVSAPPTETPVPTSRSSINPYSARPRTSGHKPSIRLNVGMDVAVEHDGKDLNGIVRWIGKIHSILKEDTFVGVELASPVSTGTDGTFHSQRFFSCQPGHAIFVKDSLCKAPLLLPIKVPARDGISVKEMNVCGHYLQNICRAGDKCDLMHPPVPSSFIWCFKQLGDVEYTCCSVNLNSEIEKAYCNPNSSKYKKAGSLEVNFELLGQCIYKSLPVSFKRFSTKSISVFPDEPMATTWKWYWLDDNQLWQEYLNEGSTRNDLIERAYHDWLHNGSTDIFKFNTLQFHYQLEFNTMHQVNLDPKYGTKRAVRRRPVLAAPTSRLSPDSSSPSTGRYPEHWPSTFPSCGYLLLKVDRNTTND
ncbi:protein mono-ADP-ribosyltransferase PARP12-like isoform X2 [Hydractinia symbiolongicarpus]|uniref:protein mono-ADP-ribosyltransferase PARP12-like isoform X2 n=1 Tax=Hydractinia symbiolongicarpus TaxID=13093 RepID=UPI00254E4284|nr:protein mono-ADP-ribosyltransferase PARP12-like isoform X2 [Hydractinia symbiolongicarpus]